MFLKCLFPFYSSAQSKKKYKDHPILTIIPPPENSFDLLVIGAGSAGIKAAVSAAKLGAKVALADYATPLQKDTPNENVCLNIESIPKELFYFASNLGYQQDDLDATGWKADREKSQDWRKTTKKITEYIKQFQCDVQHSLTENGVKYYNMTARFIDKCTVELANPQTKKKEIVTAKNILIAVGAKPRFLYDIPREHIITSEEMFYLDKNPGKTLVVGAGATALECAGFLRGFGNDVTIMVRSVVLRDFDQNCAAKVRQYMEFKGIKFIDNSIVSHIQKAKKGRKKVNWLNREHGTLHFEEYDTVIVAIGRNADTDQLNLEAAGVAYDQDTLKILTDEADQTNISSIYCLGSCAYDGGKGAGSAIDLAGDLLSQRLFGNSAKLMKYKMVARTVLSPLEYSFIGYTEEEARDKFGKENIIGYHSVFKPLEWTYVDKYPKDVCYVKMVCQKDQNEKIVGLHYVGPNAGEIMQGFATAISLGATKQSFADTVGIHPTCAEEILDLVITTDKEPFTDEDCKGCGF